MAKLTVDERLQKNDESISKEELTIEKAKQNIQSLKEKRKLLMLERDKEYANQILKMVCEKGVNSDEQREKFLQLMAQLQIPKPQSDTSTQEEISDSVTPSPVQNDEQKLTSENQNATQPVSQNINVYNNQNENKRF